MAPIGCASSASLPFSHFPPIARGPSPSINFIFFSKLPFGVLFLWLLAVPFSSGLKCLDCSGRNCMGKFCEGDYCLMSYYAPRWGTIVGGEPTVVKGCLSGPMLRHGVRSHCETADAEGEEPFTCFCDGKDYCNQRPSRRMEVEPVQLFTCVCEGAHCRERKTCTGELCTFVINHRSRERERGCVNASVPLVERRSAGACMIPPITGAMHHTVAKRAGDLLRTESCVCEGDFCNAEKPEPSVPENSKCHAFAQVELMGQKMMSKNTTCTGEYCFRADIKSKLGHLNAYRTIGCASFSRDSKLAEELEPTGCAKFNSEDLQVEVCFTTTDREAIERAKESRQNGGRKTAKLRTKNGRGKAKGMEEKEEQGEENIMEKEETEELEEKDRGRKGAREQGEDVGSRRRELKKEGEEEEETVEKEETDEEEGQTETEKGRGDGETEQPPPHFIFERPTLAPAVTESNNTTLIFVFLLLILLILLSGAVWKLQLHKRLFRASYDTVAGG